MSRVPPHASAGPKLPGADELEQLEELGDDAIIAQQQGAHAPKPRVQVTEEARSVVISDPPPEALSASPAPARGRPGRRSERNEKTVVIRDRRQIDELRREMAKRKPRQPVDQTPGVLLWVIVGLAAFVTGGLLALFATREDGEAELAPPMSSTLAPPSTAPAMVMEPPSVSIDELPIEGSKKK